MNFLITHNNADALCCAHISSRRGFTLMELLVSVTLLSIVMASVYSLINSALGTWRTVEGGFDMQFEARSFITLFSHEYNNIVGRAAHLFEGDSNTIVMFVIAQPMDLEQGEGPRLMRVEYSYNRSKRNIEREEALVEAALPLPETEGQPMDPGRIKLSRPYKVTVANNVTHFGIQYVWAPVPVITVPEEPPIPEPLIYLDRHKDKQSLPQAVEITFELADPDDKEKTYPMIVTLPMRAPTMRLPRHHLEESLNGQA